MGFFSRQSGSKSERAPEAPEYNVRLAEYEAKHKPSYYGPNFHKGPEQEEIFDRRRNGEKFPRDHPELRNRAHSYDTTDKHKVSDPYETRPLPWKKQVIADYNRYKNLGHKDRFEPVEEIISRGNNIQFGRNRKPSEQDQRAIHNASAAASKASRMANLDSQARAGFQHKYPQAYDRQDGLRTHHNEAIASRNRAHRLGKSVKHLRGESSRLVTQQRVWQEREEREKSEKSRWG